jgi:hypothetical protein
MSAEIYTHDKQLHSSWPLSEGRQRTDSGYSDLNESLRDADSERITTQDETTEKKRAQMEEPRKVKLRESEREEELKKLRLGMEQRDEELKQRDEELKKLRLEVEQVRERLRRQAERDENRAEMTQVHDMSVKERARKRKR